MCNSRKADRQEVLDPESRAMVPLSNPRVERWEEHFEWLEAGTLIHGKTPQGRATVTPVRNEADRPESIHLAPAGPSVIHVDTLSQPLYTRTHARSSMISARERRSLMSAPQADGWTRRRFLGGLTLTGTMGLLGLSPRPVAAEPPPETTRLRVMQVPNLCEAPAQAAQELLRAEGFSEVQYVQALGVAGFEKIAAGEIDLALQAAMIGVRQIDAGAPVVLLAGVHMGCFELFGHARVRTIRDLKGKVVAVSYLGGGAHLLIAIMAASVG